MKGSCMSHRGKSPKFIDSFWKRMVICGYNIGAYGTLQNKKSTLFHIDSFHLKITGSLITVHYLNYYSEGMAQGRPYCCLQLPDWRTWRRQVSEEHSDGTRGNGCTLEHGMFWLIIKKNSSTTVVTREVMGSLSLDVFKPELDGSWNNLL